MHTPTTRARNDRFCHGRHQLPERDVQGGDQTWHTHLALHPPQRDTANTPGANDLWLELQAALDARFQPSKQVYALKHLQFKPFDRLREEGGSADGLLRKCFKFPL